jgi:ribonuclease HI
MMINFVHKAGKMPQKKFYVVWKGLKPGVFETWKECEAQIKGVQGAVYKAFPSIEEAKKAFHSDWKDYITRKTSTKPIKRVIGPGGPDLNSLSVDAACSGNPGKLEYRGVETGTGREIFHKGVFPLGTVNIGEFLAIVHGLAYLDKLKSSLPVYSDSKTAIKWVKDKKIKTNLPRCSETEELFNLVDRAIAWLEIHPYPNKVIKWETETWGEIPADFGRK